MGINFMVKMDQIPLPAFSHPLNTSLNLKGEPLKWHLTQRFSKCGPFSRRVTQEFVINANPSAPPQAS